MSGMSGKAVRETLGFLGVVASLVFVGLEIRNNTVVAQAATRQSVVDQAMGLYGNIITNEQLRELIIAASADPTGFDRSPSDELLLRFYFRSVFDVMENAFYHFQNGTLDDEYWASVDRGFRSGLGTAHGACKIPQVASSSCPNSPGQAKGRYSSLHSQ